MSGTRNLISKLMIENSEEQLFAFDEDLMAADKIEIKNIAKKKANTQAIPIPAGRPNRDGIDNHSEISASVTVGTANSLYVSGFEEWNKHNKFKEVRNKLNAIAEGKQIVVDQLKGNAGFISKKGQIGSCSRMFAEPGPQGIENKVVTTYGFKVGSTSKP